jgi:hypothetical protein
MPYVKLSKKTTYKKKTTKQKQKQKQIQNVTVNVNQARSSRRRYNYAPKPQYPQSSNVSLNMPQHHTFYVESRQPQYHTLQAPNNSIQPLQAPNNSTDPLEAPEEKDKPKRGRPLGSKNREKIYAEAIEVEPVKQFNPFQQELMNATERRRRKLEQNDIPIINETLKQPTNPLLTPFQKELFKRVDERNDRLENNSNQSPHQGLNVSSSSLMNLPMTQEQNIENLISYGQMNQSLSGGAVLTEYDDLKIKDLKQLCKDRNLAVYGNKSDLIERLLLNDMNESKTRPYKKKG